MTRKRLILALTAAVLLATTGGLLIAGGYRSKSTLKRVKTWTPDLTVTARSPALGVLEFEAQATLTHPFNDTVLWWSVEVRKAADDGSFETVWEHDFDDLAHYTTAKKMVEVNAVLAPMRVPLVLPSGTYHAFVGVRYEGALFDAQGGQIERPILAGRMSDHIEVK
jgi:hypothetical protein